MLRRRPPWFDVAIALVAALALLVDGSRRGDGAITPADVALALATCAPLAWRTAHPLTVLLWTMAGLIGCLATFEPNDAAVAVLLIPLYTVAERGDRRRSLLVGAGTAVVVSVVIMAFEDGGPLGPEEALRLLVALAALGVGDIVRTRRALAAATLERVTREAREREEEGRRRIVGERLRIARELHDTIAHALVAINVRAGVAVHLDQDGDPEALREIKALSAEALTDLRSTLNLLRDEREAVPTAPAPDLAAISELVDRATVAGVQASADVALNGTTIPSPVGQAGFRIVQEAMTNVLRHAQARTASVSVRAAGGALEIDVTDDGRGGVAGGPADAAGHGLRGMAERAAALGGEVVAGPGAGGGWRVHARLPLQDGER